MSKRWILYALIFALLLTAPGPHQAGKGLAQGSEFAIGDMVEVYTAGQSLNLREGPGIAYDILAKLPDGTLMTIVGGPENGDGYEWWEIEGSLGRGWAAEDFLIYFSAQPGSTGADPATICERVEQVYPGIEYCLRDRGSTHAVLINLNDPHVRFETVIAKDAASVNTSERELVRDMAARRNTAVAATADYSGAGHGPEGLTIINGVRLDGVKNGDDDNNAVFRSSLITSRGFLDGGTLPIQAEVVRLADDFQPLDFNRYFTAAGGGPQVIFDGQWEWSRSLPNPRYNECIPDDLEDIINGECFVDSRHWDYPDTRWTAVGITSDGKLVILVAPYRQVQNTFARFGVQNAIKMDGGGSAQLWVAGKEVVASSDEPDRALASGFLVEYLYSASVTDAPRWAVLVEDEPQTIYLSLKNSGSDTWKAGEYQLVNEKNPLGQTGEVRALDRDVPPGGTVSWTWDTGAYQDWGIYNTYWRMMKGSQPFPGDPVILTAVVIPKKLEQKKVELEGKIQEWIAQGTGSLEDLARQWIQDMLEEKLIQCPVSSLGLPGLALVAAGIRWRRKVLRAKHPA